MMWRRAPITAITDTSTTVGAENPITRRFGTRDEAAEHIAPGDRGRIVPEGTQMSA